MKPQLLPALLNFSAAALLLLSVLVLNTESVSAQATPPALDALTDRVKKLEARVAEDEQQGASGGTKASSNRVRTPFVIVDSKGKEVLVVDEAPGGGVLRMGGVGSGPAINLRVTQSAAEVTTQLGGGDNVARMLVSENIGARIVVREGESSTLIGNGGDNKHGLLVRKGKGDATPKTVGELALTYGETGGILRLFDKDGKQVISAGSNAKEGGRGQIGVGPPGGQVGVLLTHAPDGDGEVEVFGGGTGKPLIALNGSQHLIALYNKAGAAAVTLGLSQSGAGPGGNITARDGKGDGIFSAGLMSGGGGTACINHIKRGTICMGTNMPGFQ